MQGIPIHKDALRAAQISKPFFDPDLITPAAQKRLAGNSFHQACMTAFLSFALAFVMPAADWDESKGCSAPVRPLLNQQVRHTFCSSSDSSEENE